MLGLVSRIAACALALSALSAAEMAPPAGAGGAAKKAKKALKKTKQLQEDVNAVLVEVQRLATLIAEIEGEPGPRGPRGAMGPQGPPGDSGITSPFVELAASPSGNTQQLLVHDGVTYAARCDTTDEELLDVPEEEDPYTRVEIRVSSAGADDYFLYMGDSEFYPLSSVADWFFLAFDNTGTEQFFADDGVVAGPSGTVHSVEGIVGVNVFGSDCVAQVTVIPR